MSVQILLTGDELMSGDIVDTNSVFFSEILATLGITPARRVTVGDDLAQLVDEIRNMAEQSEVLIINGGLGPTVDDLTAVALGKMSGEPLVENREAVAHLQTWCQQRKITLDAANMKQAMLPASATTLPNPVGSAVGIKMTYNGCLIIATPGVPVEMKPMMRDSVMPLLKQHLSISGTRNTKRLKVFGIGESSLQQLLSDQIPDWPETVELGFRAGMPMLELKLTIRSPEAATDRDRCMEKIEALIGDLIVGEIYPGEDDLAYGKVIVDLLAQKGKTLTTAESCTGGLIASQLTAIAGASSVFEAGFVTYSNLMKMRLLGVPGELLETDGAVSEAVVIAMVKGALARSSSDLAIAVSGIAGPEGGTAEKPVGTVWIAWGTEAQVKTLCLQLTLPRKVFQAMVSAAVLDLIRRELLEITEPPRWLQRYQRQ